MNLKELTSFIRSKGCRVRLYNRRTLVASNCTGYFDDTAPGGPIIHMAIKGRSKVKLRGILLHEFAHYIQSKIGMFDQMGELSSAWSVLDEMLSGATISDKELKEARASILAIEYSAELITLALARHLKVDIGKERKYLQAVESYLTLIKWAFHAKKFPYGASYKYFDGKQLSWRELFSPITPKEIAIMQKK